PENAVVPLVEEIPGNVIPSVLSLDFHGALDLHNLKHQNNGAFHYFYKASEQKAYTGYTQFQMLTLQNSLFGSLKFHLSSRDHNETLPVDNLLRLSHNMAELLRTGALAGYSLKHCQHL